MCRQPYRMLKTSTRLLQLLALPADAAIVVGRASWPRSWTSPRGPCATTSNGCAIWATRCTPRPAWREGIGWAPGADLPPLLLDDEEAVAVAVGLASAATGAVTGIEEASLAGAGEAGAGDARPGAAPLPDRPAGVVALPRPAAAGRRPRTLTAIAAACRDNERLRFDYSSHTGGSSTARHRAPPRGPRRPALVPGGVGSRTRRLAHVPRRQDGAAGAGWPAVRAPPAPGVAM